MAHSVCGGISGLRGRLRTPQLEAAVTWASGAATDTGLVRARNEDRYWADAERGVFLVVDGVGGHVAGELAAQTAVDVIRESTLDTESAMGDAITRANNRIFEI